MFSADTMMRIYPPIILELNITEWDLILRATIDYDTLQFCEDVW